MLSFKTILAFVGNGVFSQDKIEKSNFLFFLENTTARILESVMNESQNILRVTYVRWQHTSRTVHRNAITCLSRYSVQMTMMISEWKKKRHSLRTRRNVIKLYNAAGRQNTNTPAATEVDREGHLACLMTDLKQSTL